MPLKIWLTISAYSPQKDYFVAVFENITERKKAEGELKKYHILQKFMAVSTIIDVLKRMKNMS